MSVLRILLVASSWMAACSEPGHLSWETTDRDLAEITDILWNYCDLKCLYFESVVPKDFVVMTFRIKLTKEEFQACYVNDHQDQEDEAQYRLWNTLVSNPFYEHICGKETVDYLEASQHYRLIKLEGVGIGTEIFYPFERANATT